MKEKYLRFIRDFSSISIKRICEEKNLDRSCVLRGRSSEEKTRILYQALLDEIQKIIPEEETNEKSNSNNNADINRRDRNDNDNKTRKKRKNLHQVANDMQQDTRRPL